MYRDQRYLTLASFLSLSRWKLTLTIIVKRATIERKRYTKTRIDAEPTIYNANVYIDNFTAIDARSRRLKNMESREKLSSIDDETRISWNTNERRRVSKTSCYPALILFLFSYVLRIYGNVAALEGSRRTSYAIIRNKIPPTIVRSIISIVQRIMKIET